MKSFDSEWRYLTRALLRVSTAQEKQNNEEYYKPERGEGTGTRLGKYFIFMGETYAFITFKQLLK